MRPLKSLLVLLVLVLLPLCTLSAKGGADGQKSPARGGAAPVDTALRDASPTRPKYALVIGNGEYANIARLNNPVNDANDMTAALKSLGFQVDTVLNGSQDQMEDAVISLKKRLSADSSAYGFFFYAGHGVQSGGENYLIPVDADIKTESLLKQRAVAVQQFMLDELNAAGNALNIIVLDACRDNPFSWARSASRGLTVMGSPPADSIIVYATGVGQVAEDGTGRNGLFTGELVKNLTIPGLEVHEIFKRTGASVAQASGRKQIPEVSDRFFETAYLGEAAVEAVTPPPASSPAPASNPAPARPEVLDWQNALDTLLKPGNVDVLKGWNLAVVAPGDPLSRGFGVVFVGTLRAKGLNVVYQDNTVIQKEIDRQMSGMVDNQYVKALGRQYGAEVSIQLLITRNMDAPNQIKIQMKAANVETNAVMASGAAIVPVPAATPNYDEVSLEAGTRSDETKRAAMAFLEGKVSPVYVVLPPLPPEPQPPPPPSPPPPKKPFKLPALDRDRKYFGVMGSLSGYAGTGQGAAGGGAAGAFSNHRWYVSGSLPLFELTGGYIVTWFDAPLIGDTGLMLGIGESGITFAGNDTAFSLFACCGFLSRLITADIRFFFWGTMGVGIGANLSLGYKWEL